MTPSKEQITLATELGNLAPFAEAKNQGFILSLCNVVLRRNTSLTEKQLYWAKKYHHELSQLREAGKAASSKAASSQTATQAATLAMTFPNLAALFAKALNSKLAYPKISYDLENCRLVLAYSPSYASIAIRVGNRSIGALALNGAMSKSYPIKDAKILACLVEIEKDPIKAAKLSGKQTNHCCFCSRELTDARSVIHGYGPICAEHWNLPWDDLTSEQKKATRVIYSLEGRTEEEL